MQTPPFSKVLIANRGEIAVRIAAACRELGIRSAAVYSRPDADALHVRAADEAVLLGEASPAESYLNMEKIIRAAQETGAQAVHPGYGFLSENAAFASAVEAAGLVFIGPSPDSIRRMGDKAGSKISMREAAVPTIPGFEGLESPEDFRHAAAQIGFPVLVKAAAGGGGKGIRVVEDESALPEAVEGARREALHAFGDGRLLVEKYLPRAITWSSRSLATGTGISCISSSANAQPSGGIRRSSRRRPPRCSRRNCAPAWEPPRWRPPAPSATSTPVRSSSSWTRRAWTSTSWR